MSTITSTERYARVVEVSKRVRWEIERDVIRSRRFDYTKTFLPSGLSLVDELAFLTQPTSACSARCRAARSSRSRPCRSRPEPARYWGDRPWNKWPATWRACSEASPPASAAA